MEHMHLIKIYYLLSNENYIETIYGNFGGKCKRIWIYYSWWMVILSNAFNLIKLFKRGRKYAPIMYDTDCYCSTCFAEIYLNWNKHFFYQGHPKNLSTLSFVDEQQLIKTNFSNYKFIQSYEIEFLIVPIATEFRF